MNDASVASIVAHLRPRAPQVRLALGALTRVAQQPSEVLDLNGGPASGAFIAMLADLRKRLTAALAGRAPVANAKRGDVVVVPAGPRRRSVIVIAVVNAREVAVFDGACANASRAVAHAAVRPARRVALASSATALLAAGQVVANLPLRADLKEPKRYASELAVLGDSYALSSASFGQVDEVTYDVARQFDRLDPLGLAELRDVALRATAPGRVRSPAAREAAYVMGRGVAWRRRRARTTPHAFGDLEVLTSVAEWVREFGVKNAVDVHVDIAEGRQGYGRPDEEAERRCYAFCGLVAWWRVRWGARALPRAVAAMLPATLPPRALARALRAARVLVTQVIGHDAELRLLWERAPDRGAQLREAVTSLRDALAA